MSGPPVNTGKPEAEGAATPSRAARGLGIASEVVSSALSGYQAGYADPGLAPGRTAVGAGLAAASAYFAVSAAFAASTVAGPIAAAVAAAIYIFSATQGASKARREAQRAANIIVQTQPAGATALPYRYGYNRVQPVPVYMGIVRNNGLPGSATAYKNGFGHMFRGDELGDPAIRRPRVSDEAIALMQYDLAAQGRVRFLDATYGGQSLRYDGGGSSFSRRAFAKVYPAGTAGDFAALFDPVDRSNRRTARTTFLGKPHLDALFWQWYEDAGGGLFSGPVELDSVWFFADEVRIPTRTGTGQAATYGLSSTKSESRNTFAVAADFLLNPDKGPAGVTEADIHMQSLFDAYEIANEFLGSGAAGTAGGTLDQATRRKDCRGLLVNNGGIERSARQELYEACLARLGNRGTGGNANTGLSANARVMRTDEVNYEKRRYQFDGDVPSDSTPGEGFSAILATAPGAIAYRDNEGLLRFDVPDASIDEDHADFVQGEINDAHLLARPEVQRPTSAESANSVTVTHPNVNSDLYEDQVVAPTPGGAFAGQLEALDGEEIPTDLALPNTIDPEMAHSNGLNYMLQRRRGRWTFITSLSPFRFLEGMRIRLRHSDSGVNVVVRILGKQVVANTIRWSGIEYASIDYGYYPQAIDPFDEFSPSVAVVPPPTAVTAAYDLDTHRMNVSWTPPANRDAVGHYEIERASVRRGAAVGDSDWRGVASVDGDATGYPDSVDTGERDYKYRVRSAGARGGLSAWAESATVTATRHDMDVVYDGLPEGRNCPPADRVADLWVTPTGVFRYAGDPWGFAVPSDVGASGVHGVIWRASGVALTSVGTPVRQLRLTAPADQTAMSDGVTVTDGTVLQRLEFRVDSDHTFLRMQPGQADFNAEIERDVGFALRDSDGNTIFYEKTNTDDREPYEWFDAATRVANTRAAEAFVTRTGAPPFDMFFYRPSLRCSGEPLNPWTPQFEFDAADAAGFEFAYSLAADDTPLQSAELPPITTPYRAAVDAQGADNGFTAGGRTWFANEQQTTSALPFLVVVWRDVRGAPERGDPPESTWSAWRGPVFRRLYSAPPEQEEAIYAASATDSLADGEAPLDSWTLGQVASTTGGVARGSVVWATTLEAAGYDADKPYGFKATRFHPPAAAVGSAVSDAWFAQLFAHFGLDGADGESGQDGRLSVFDYNNLVGTGSALPAADGSHMFLKGTANAGGSWAAILDADAILVGDDDERGLPALVLEDLGEEDWIVYQPETSQWATFDVTGAPTEVANGWRVPVELASSRGTGDVSASNNSRILFSRPRRAKPGYSKSYKYNFQNNVWSPANAGRFGRYSFHTGTTPSAANIVDIGAGKFADVVADCRALAVSLEDDNGNTAVAWDKQTAEAEAVITYEQDRRQWCAWEVVSVDRSNAVGRDDPYMVFRLRLLAYDASAGLDLPSAQGADDVRFRLSEYARDLPSFLQVDLEPIPDQPIEATTYAASATVSGANVTSATKVDWLWFVHGGGASVSWLKTNTGLTSEATLTFGAIAADSRVTVTAIARVPGSDGEGFAADDEVFTRRSSTQFAGEILANNTAGTPSGRQNAPTVVVGAHENVSLTVQFSDQSGAKTPYAYAWSTSGSETITGAASATAVYGGFRRGTRLVSVRVTDANGVVAAIKALTLRAEIHRVDIEPLSGSGAASGTIPLRAVTRAGAGLGTPTYAWTVENGTLSATNTESVTLTLPASGSARVTLNVTRGAATASRTRTYEVLASPPFALAVSADPTVVTVPPAADVAFTVVFSNPSTLAEVQMQRFGELADDWIDYGADGTRGGATAKNQSSPWTYTHTFPAGAAGAVSAWRVKYKKTAGDEFQYSDIEFPRRTSSEALVTANRRT